MLSPAILASHSHRLVCTMSVNHYENFPVASFLLPARLRPAVHAIYTFARSADDIADEGEATPTQRLQALQEYDDQLDLIEQHKLPTHRQFIILQEIITQFQLPVTPLRQLLSAFKQDIVKTRYASYTELLDYCRRSANPVGITMLHLYSAATPQNCRDSDAICSALQLINFIQDVAIDWEKQRIYLPTEDLVRFGLTEDNIRQQQHDIAWQKLISFEVQRTRSLMLSGSALPRRLPGRIGWELRGVVQGGLRILERIEQAQGNVFQHRPVLNKWDWLVIAWRMCFH